MTSTSLPHALITNTAALTGSDSNARHFHHPNNTPMDMGELHSAGTTGLGITGVVGVLGAHAVALGSTASIGGFASG